MLTWFIVLFRCTLAFCFSVYSLFIFESLILKVAQLCPTIYDPIDCSPRGSSAHGILLARILERIQPLSSLGDLPDPEIEAGSPALHVDSLPSEPPGKPSNYIELVHSAFQIYSIFLLFYLLILFIFEFDIETPTKSLIYLLKRVIAIENPPANAGDTCQLPLQQKE